jgi:uncharacterized protein involved in exopolysaccharide biosynthesis
MSGGRHGHTIRRLRRRIDAVLEEEQERHRPLPPPPPPISEEHAALRRQIAESYRILLEDPENPEGIDQLERFEKRFEERAKENPELDNIAAEYIALVRKEVGLLAENGVDYGPYENYEFE